MNQNPQRSKFESEVTRLTPSLKSYLRTRLSSEQDVEDASQDILLNLFRTAGDDLIGITNLPAWLFRAASNMISNILRRKSYAYTDDDIILSILGDEAYSPETHLLRQLFWEKLESALEQLPAEQRQVWEMTELEGIRIKEISYLTHIPQATLLSRKHYAVKSLRYQLRKLYKEILET